jgi:hypothetical protein
MQIVTNKVENGYICTKDGKMFVFRNLTEVTAFFIQEFNEPVVNGLLQKLISLPSLEYESITSDSK